MAQACEELTSRVGTKDRLGRAETWHCQGSRHVRQDKAMDSNPQPSPVPWFAQKVLPAAEGWQRSKASTGDGHRKAAIVHSHRGVTPGGAGALHRHRGQARPTRETAVSSVPSEAGLEAVPADPMSQRRQALRGSGCVHKGHLKRGPRGEDGLAGSCSAGLCVPHALAYSPDLGCLASSYTPGFRPGLSSAGRPGPPWLDPGREGKENYYRGGKGGKCADAPGDGRGQGRQRRLRVSGRPGSDS